MIWPGAGVLPGGSNSSPVAMMATSGRRTTGSVAWFAEAASDSAAASSTRPAIEQRVAFLEIEPGVTDVAAGCDRLHDLDRRASTRRAFSWMRMVSAPVRHRRTGEDAHRLAFADRCRQTVQPAALRR